MSDAIEPADLPQIEYLPMDVIEPNPFQYRQVFSDAELEELAGSIREHGVLQPILARPVADKTHKGITHQLVAGERRWRAAQLAELKQIPAIVRPIDDLESAKIAVVENAQRVDPPHFATAKGLKNYAAMSAARGKPLNENQLAREMGKSLGFVRNHLRLEALDEPLQDLVAHRNDAMSSAFELEKIQGHRDYRPLIEDVKAGKANWRAVKSRVDFIIKEQKWQRESSRAPDAETRSAIARQTERAREALRETKSALGEATRHISNIEAYLDDLSDKDFQNHLSPQLQNLIARASRIVESKSSEKNNHMTTAKHGC